MYNFQVGQKVVCINVDIIETPNRPYQPPEGDEFFSLTLDKIYTIRRIDIDPIVGEEVMVWLHEIHRTPYSVMHDDPKCRGLEEGFFAWRFRPLEEKKTDISIFTSLPLDKITYTPHKVKENV